NLIVDILNQHRIPRSTYIRGKLTRGYRFEYTDFGKPEITTCIMWYSGDVVYPSDNQKLKHIYQLLIENGLGEFLDEFRPEQNMIRFKQVKERKAKYKG